MSGADKGRERSQRGGNAKPARRQHDWIALRTEWAAGDLSLRAFAAAHDMDPTLIAKRASRDGWVAAREALRGKVAAGAERKVVAHRIRAESEIDGQAHRAAGRFARTVGALLKRATTGEARVSLDDAPKLKALVETLEKAHRLARVTAHLAPEPVAQVVQSRQVVIVRGVDADGLEYVERLSDADSGPAGLPADEDTGGVHPQ